MPNKLRVGIIFGGRSGEHEVSLQSAKNVISALDRKKYEVVLIGIDKEGGWYLQSDAQFLLNYKGPKLIKLNKSEDEVGLLPMPREANLISLTGKRKIGQLDVIFPVLHGPYGEDGTIQGLLEMANIPYVGAGVLGSSLSMDKDVMKRLLREAGIPIAKFLTFERGDYEKGEITFAGASKGVGSPFFVKPANLGSSVGITKVKKKSKFRSALKEAFSYDNKILIEENIEGREIECAVLGNEDPIASVPGEIIPRHEFYSYEAKYIDEKGAALEIPAKISQKLKKKVQRLALRAFKVLCCSGMARVDFFIRKVTEEVILSEINTIPGFTKISMYPKLWEASGISYRELIDRLIQLAIERHKRKSSLKVSYSPAGSK